MDYNYEERREIATRAMCALIGRAPNPVSEKKRVVDNAIAYADMLLKRLKEIPADAQQRSENGQKLNKK